MLIVNASDFHVAPAHQDCVIYSASPQDVVPIASWCDALNPAHWQTRYHPFSQVMVNAVTGEFLLVRDQLGLRPLYYWHQANALTSDKLIFGDTIPDILRHLSSTPALVDSEIINLFADVNRYSDDTLYEGIKRVEPGHMMHGTARGHLTKRVFWQLEPEGATLHYQDKGDYLAHFTVLMNESIAIATTGAHKIAAEFSAGMDSTAVYCACVARGLNPTLFMNAATPNSESAQTYNTHYEKALIEHHQLHAIQRIQATDFDPIRIFKEYAAWFAGPSPYIFEMFANPLHKAVALQGHTLLLSGFGGDQGVSHPIPTRFILPDLLANRAYKQAWRELAAPKTVRGSKMHAIRRLLQLTQYAHPLLHQLIQGALDLKQKGPVSKHPYHRLCFKTLRDAEWSFLQGPYSHEIRMRIEYSSIVTKKLGFEYRYPLLYPKLLEFFLSIPTTQKRYEGAGRFLLRRYLAQQLPTALFDTYQKKEGLSILPATMDYFKPRFFADAYNDEFSALPYPALIQDKLAHKRMTKTIQAFMLNEAQGLTNSYNRRQRCHLNHQETPYV